MANQKMQSAETVVAEQNLSIEEMAQAIEAIRAQIEELDRKETVLAEGLIKAKEKGLIEQADRCRELLQKVVVDKNVKKDELNEMEARKLAAELDAMTSEVARDLGVEALSEEERFAEERAYFAKAKRLKLVSKMIGFIGVLACLVGSLVYLIFTQAETLNLPFEWLYLAVTGVAAVIFIIISMLVASSANKYQTYGEMIVAEREEEERIAEEMLKEAAFAASELNVAAEVYNIEQAKKVEMDEAKKPAPKKFWKVNLKDVNVPETLKKNVHKAVPVAAVATTAVAVAALVSSQKKVKAAKRSAAARREFFNWLG